MESVLFLLNQQLALFNEQQDLLLKPARHKLFCSCMFLKMGLFYLFS